MRAGNPLRLALMPDDLAGAYVFLASRRDAKGITGTILTVDAGTLLRAPRGDSSCRAKGLSARQCRLETILSCFTHDPAAARVHAPGRPNHGRRHQRNLSRPITV